MKKITKFKKFNLHLRIFILIALSLFVMVGIMHINMLVSGDFISLGDTVLPHTVNYFALFGILWMVVMGVYYYIALKD